MRGDPHVFTFHDFQRRSHLVRHTHHLRRDPRGIPEVLRGEGLPALAVLLAGSRRPQPAAHRSGHGPVQALLPAAKAPRCALHRRDDGAKMRAHQRHRPDRHRRPAPELFRDARQLQLRRLLQEGDVRLGLGVFHESAPAGPGAHSRHGLHRRRRGAPDLAHGRPAGIAHHAPR